MNRIVLSLIFVMALLGVQGLSLHAHLPHANDADAVPSHSHIHVHSQAVDQDFDADHDHSDAVPIDLLTSPLARDHISLSFDFTLQAILIFALVVVWRCIERMPAPIPIVYFNPHRRRKPSPRAPPR